MALQDSITEKPSLCLQFSLEADSVGSPPRLTDVQRGLETWLSHTAHPWLLAAQAPGFPRCPFRKVGNQIWTASANGLDGLPAALPGSRSSLCPGTLTFRPVRWKRITEDEEERDGPAALSAGGAAWPRLGRGGRLGTEGPHALPRQPLPALLGRISRPLP